MKTQKRSNQLKQIETQSQSGRSMVEMLGVLAIIGVLSIGGIAGYKYAMNYYQANQIAHEINLMRTDAQVKIAQGADELVLGNPYDDGNINFNNYETDFDCVYMENENATPELAFCTAANAYYIEMKNIPEGICRPLANLIDKMDNEIAFYINGKSVDAEAEGEKGACNEESNTLRVIFGADSDSNAVKCDDDSDCPEDLPVCFNHVCVECTQEKGCEGKSQYCKDNTCKTCESGVWNGEKCVECTDNDDCESKTDTPVCNRDTNKCVECKTATDCAGNPNGSVCEENRCVCSQSSQCQQKETAPYCDKSAKQCTACPDGGTYSNEEQACVISVYSAPFDQLSSQTYQCIIQSVNPKFGPYEHTYTLYMKGLIDDWLVFYKDAQTDMTQSCPPPTGYTAKIPCLPQAEVRCDVAQPRSRTAIGDLEAGHTGTLVAYSVITYLRNHATVWGVLKE